MKANYKIIYDGIYSYIVCCDTYEIEVDDYTYFKTYTQAKNYLIQDMQYRLSDYRNAMAGLKATKKGDIGHLKDEY